MRNVPAFCNLVRNLIIYISIHHSKDQRPTKYMQRNYVEKNCVQLTRSCTSILSMKHTLN